LKIFTDAQAGFETQYTPVHNPPTNLTGHNIIFAVKFRVYLV